MTFSSETTVAATVRELDLGIKSMDQASMSCPFGALEMNRRALACPFGALEMNRRAVTATV